jgi:probable rRNA maturation factor
LTIEINNESGIEVDEPALVRLARFALTELQVHPLAELSMILVDVDAMSALHEEWMDESGPTDVLSFPMDELRPGSWRGADPDGRSHEEPDEPLPILGDIVLCPEVARKQAETAGHGLADELNMLTVHGILHILGFDHAEPDEEVEMFGRQREILQAWKAES